MKDEDYDMLYRTAKFEAIEWDGNRYIAVVRYKKDEDFAWYRDILTSEDGYTWKRHPLPIKSRDMYEPSGIDDHTKPILTEDGFIFVGNNNSIVFVEYIGEDKPYIPVNGIELEKKELLLRVGEWEKLVYEVYPLNATNKNVIWESSGESVATVDEDGYVLAVGPGVCVIMARTIDGINSEACLVRVSSYEEEVNKDELIELIEEVKDLNKDDYTRESWREFEDALEHAIYIRDKKEATEEEVAYAIEYLKNAWNELERVEEEPKEDEEYWQMLKTEDIYKAWHIKFNQALDPTTLNYNSVILKDEDGNKYIGGQDYKIYLLEDNILVLEPLF